MKPRKKVLLLASNDVEQSLWRMRLDVVRYAVLAAATAEQARAQLGEHPDCTLALVQWPSERVSEEAIGRLRRSGRKVLLFGCRPGEAAGMAVEGCEVAGPVLVARVLERAKGLLAGKRGPKPKPRAELKQAA